MKHVVSVATIGEFQAYSRNPVLHITLGKRAYTDHGLKLANPTKVVVFSVDDKQIDIPLIFAHELAQRIIEVCDAMSEETK